MIMMGMAGSQFSLATNNIMRPIMIMMGMAASQFSLAYTATATTTMNSRPYVIANPNLDTTASSYSTEYPDSEYFEVYSPLIRTRYSEVFWSFLDSVPLPTEIVDRFRNKVMAVTGYEVDQVRIINEQTRMEESVPITWAYNHHYGAFLVNENEAFQQELEDNYHNHSYRWIPSKTALDSSSSSSKVANTATNEEVPKEEEEYSRNEFFSEGNGGEFRSSYHGYPRGYAQLLQNPDHFQLCPMQIDTWNRTAMQHTPLYHPGPLPQSSRIPQSAGYNGLLECPCSDRVTKLWAMTYATSNTPDRETTRAADLEESCQEPDERFGPIQNASECLQAAQAVVPSNHYRLQSATVGKATNCSVVQHPDGSVDVLWNTQYNNDSNKGKEKNKPMKEFVAFSSTDQINVTLVLDEAQHEVTIHLIGPSDVWFGIGFGASSMCVHPVADECPDGGPYAIIISAGNSNNGDHDAVTVMERKLDPHGPGQSLDSSSLQIVSNSVSAQGNRTVILKRPMQGATPQHYTFLDPTQMEDPEDENDGALNIITAQGCDFVFGSDPHCGHGTSSLVFLQLNRKTRLCRAGIKGTIGGLAFDNTNRCADPPVSDLARQGNPTCTIQTYQGGLSCCHHGQSLLDTNQDIPWPDEYLEYRFKFRFYFQEYTPGTETQPASHKHLTRVYWATEAFAGEYDIPQCAPLTPPDQCVHMISSKFSVREAVWSNDLDDKKGIKLIYAGPHCHAPSCLSMELYNADTGELLCHVEPIHGLSGELYDETGFLAIPPCLWGSPDEGLVEPKFLSLDTTLLSIKRNNNTLPHTGDMASWQMRAILIPKDSQEDEDDYRDVESTIQEEQEIMDQVEEAEQESSVSRLSNGGTSAGIATVSLLRQKHVDGPPK